MLKQLGLALACLALVLGTTPAQAAENLRVRGTIQSLKGEVLTIKTQGGAAVQVHLTPKTPVRFMVKLSLADIKVNSYIGTAATTLPDGRLKAMEVLVFPEAARGTAEGHFPWDLGSESTMTNATVASQVSQVDGPELTLKYKGGEQKLVVPSDVPVVTFHNGDRTMLKRGTYVVAFAIKGDDGKVMARFVAVTHKGVKPPM